MILLFFDFTTCIEATFKRLEDGEHVSDPKLPVLLKGQVENW